MTWGKDYNGGMTAWTSRYGNIVQLGSITASSSAPGLGPELVLHRQNGWNTVHDKKYFDNHEAPYNWGIHSYLWPNSYTKPSLWSSETSKQEWLQASFADGEATVLKVRVWVPEFLVYKKYDEIASVFVGEQLCGVIRPEESWIQDDGTGDITVHCYKPIKGSFVKIQIVPYKRGYVSDVMVFSTVPRPEYLQLHKPSYDYA